MREPFDMRPLARQTGSFLLMALVGCGSVAGGDGGGTSEATGAAGESSTGSAAGPPLSGSGGDGGDTASPPPSGGAPSVGPGGGSVGGHGGDGGTSTGGMVTGSGDPTSSGPGPTTGSGGMVDPFGPWQVNETCAIEVLPDGLACDEGMNFGELDSTFANPCPNNCIRNNHTCTWICRPTCEPNPDPCGEDPCAAEGYGQCALGICWQFSHCTCVNQGLCEDCASSPCP